MCVCVWGGGSGGEGYSHTRIFTLFFQQKPDDVWDDELVYTSAWGLVLGCSKYVCAFKAMWLGTVAKWALMLNIAARESSLHQQSECRSYATDVLGKVPLATQGHRYLGKFRVEELLVLREIGVTICFHEVKRGWMYYLPAFRCHIFWNETPGKALSLAHDVDDKACCPEAEDFFSHSPSAEDRLRARIPERMPMSATTDKTWGPIPPKIKGACVRDLRPGVHCECGALLLTEQHKEEIKTLGDFFSLLDSTKTSVVFFRGWTDSGTVSSLAQWASAKPRVSIRGMVDWRLDPQCDSLDHLVGIIKKYVTIHRLMYDSRPTELHCESDEQVMDILQRNVERNRKLSKVDGLEYHEDTNIKESLFQRTDVWSGKGTKSVVRRLLGLYDDAVTLRLALLRETRPNAHVDTASRRFLDFFKPTVIKRSKAGRVLHDTVRY